MAVTERVRLVLDSEGIAFEAHDHPPEPEAQRLAALEHVSGWQVAKPVLLWADGELVMGLVAAPVHVDLDKVKVALAAERVRLAAEPEFVSVFADCEEGAEPPFGNLYDVPVYADRQLLESPKLVCRAGSHSTTITIATQDFVRLVGPTEADIAADVGESG